MDLDIIGLLETDLHVQSAFYLGERNLLTTYSGLCLETEICGSSQCSVSHPHLNLGKDARDGRRDGLCEYHIHC